MSCLQVIGLKPDLDTALDVLRDLGCMHIDHVDDFPEITVRPLRLAQETMQTEEDLRVLLSQAEGILDILGGTDNTPQIINAADHSVAEVRNNIALLASDLQRLTTKKETLQANDTLPRYEATLQKLLVAAPMSAKRPGQTSVGVLVSRAHIDVLDVISKEVFNLTDGQVESVARDVDNVTRAMLIVFPNQFTHAVDSLLGRHDVSRLRLPDQAEQGSLDTMLLALQQRKLAIPTESAAIDSRLTTIAAEWRSKLLVWRYGLSDQLNSFQILSRLGETDTTFVLMGWSPAERVEALRQALQERIGQTIFVRELPMTPALSARAPIELENPLPVKPFEGLIRLQALPHYGSLDPSALLAVFMPVFFGMMLGDIGYGILLLIIILGLMRRFKRGMARDLLIVLAFGSCWSIVFGILFGELFGTLGESLGMHPLLFDRASPQHIVSLLIMTVAVGAAHIVLGLFLGIWQALKMKRRSHIMERGGMLVGLVALLLIVSVLADLLPQAFLTPAVAVLITGIVLLGASMGWLGILMGPIEFIGMIGNLLSYLRIAAIGLASVYLAKIANDVAGLLGSLVVGIIVAVLIHALNLVLGAFSPSIQSLRLHYVEFFRKFYDGGGRPYEPFRSELKSESRS